MYPTFPVQTNLELSQAQTAVLALLAEAVGRVGHLAGDNTTMRALVSSPLAVAATAAVAGMQCPYDDPPEAIVGDFDANRNMYLHCLHPTKHCWSIGGQSITCP